jgi:hypothetical protein
LPPQEDKISKAIEDIRTVHNIQGQKGNWDVDPYMTGLYNGLELALATLEGRDPQFRKFKKRSLLSRFRSWVFLKIHKGSSLVRVAQ